MKKYRELCKQKEKKKKKKLEEEISKITTEGEAWKYINKIRKIGGIGNRVSLSDWEEYFKEIF